MTHKHIGEEDWPVIALTGSTPMKHAHANIWSSLLRVKHSLIETKRLNFLKGVDYW